MHSNFEMLCPHNKLEVLLIYTLYFFFSNGDKMRFE